MSFVKMRYVYFPIPNGGHDGNSASPKIVTCLARRQ